MSAHHRDRLSVGSPPILWSELSLRKAAVGHEEQLLPGRLSVCCIRGGRESRLAESGDGERELPRRDAPSTRAFIPSRLSRKPVSISGIPRATVVAVPSMPGCQAVSGRQRKHGRNPARSATAAVGKNRTFSDFAGRT